MRKLHALLLLFLVSLLWGGHALAGEKAHRASSQARLQDVRVWYYGQGVPPVLVKWWTPDGLQVDREFIYPRGEGRFRIRTLTEGSQDVWVSIAFRDRSLGIYELPLPRQRTVGSVKDVYFQPPPEVESGRLELHVALWDGDPTLAGLERRMSARTGFLRLGRVEGEDDEGDGAGRGKSLSW